MRALQALQHMQVLALLPPIVNLRMQLPRTFALKIPRSTREGQIQSLGLRRLMHVGMIPLLGLPRRTVDPLQSPLLAPRHHTAGHPTNLWPERRLHMVGL